MQECFTLSPYFISINTSLLLNILLIWKVGFISPILSDWDITQLVIELLIAVIDCSFIYIYNTYSVKSQEGKGYVGVFLTI